MKENIITLEGSKMYSSDPRAKWIYENLYSKYGDFEVVIENDKVIIHGNVLVPGYYETLPIKIDEIYGNIIVDNIDKDIFYGKLTSLKNFPTKIHGNFICKLNPKLTTLKDGPKEIDGDFICAGCGLTTIEDMPDMIGGNFIVFGNKIINMFPVLSKKIVGLIDIEFNPCESSDLYKKLKKENKLIVS